MDSLRLDKWLWAARFYKTRSLATEAISGGHVHLNNERIKPAKAVKVGDLVRVRRGALEMTVSVVALSDRRGSATIARALYEETAESIDKREAAKAQIRAERAGMVTEGRPDKHERREIMRIKKGQN